jgi:tetratricopeptide (TPR) repeat protein
MYTPEHIYQRHPLEHISQRHTQEYISKKHTPAHIYKRPSDDLSMDTVIGVFRFLPPEYAPGSGYAAAAIFYRELLERGFKSVTAEFDVHDIRLDNIMEIAEKKNYELIITGQITYYISGNELQESRVDEQIKVIDVSTRETIWYAEAVEIGKPVYASDYIFFSTTGRNPPSPTVLMRRNARKFSNMFLTTSKEQKSLPKDMRLVNDGYNYMVTKKYEKAKSLFEKALNINPDNAYALLNLGFVHEKQGNTEQAIKLYQKIIALYQEDINKASNGRIKIEQSLLNLTKERLLKGLGE